MAWSDTCRKVLERDGFKCQLCGCHTTEIHHKDGTDENNTISHTTSNLMTCCSDCHDLFHTISLVEIRGKYYVRGEIFKKLHIIEPIGEADMLYDLKKNLGQRTI